MLEKMTSAANEFVDKLPKTLTRVGAALLVLAVGYVLLRLGRRLLKRIFIRYRQKHGSNTRGDTVQYLTTSLFNVVMYFAIVLTALSTLGVDVASLIALAGFSGFALAFGCQTLIKDIISGMFLWFEGSCNVGDIVTVAGQTGRIENVALRTTTLRAVNGSVYVIPNGEIRTVMNMTSDYRCAVVDVTVAHGQDYEKALDVLRQAMRRANEEFDYISEDPVVKGYISMDRGAATCRIECFCSVDKCWELERGIRLRALTALAEAGIKP
ncbi:MAG: mechanosensitive ion channel family protein [Clostridiales bacterium]|nr:mechanosensitive ion channel family protein [Clostridiales bacterium]